MRPTVAHVCRDAGVLQPKDHPEPHDELVGRQVVLAPLHGEGAHLVRGSGRGGVRVTVSGRGRGRGRVRVMVIWLGLGAKVPTGR